MIHLSVSPPSSARGRCGRRRAFVLLNTLVFEAPGGVFIGRWEVRAAVHERAALVVVDPRIVLVVVVHQHQGAVGGRADDRHSVAVMRLLPCHRGDSVCRHAGARFDSPEEVVQRLSHISLHDPPWGLIRGGTTPRRMAERLESLVRSR